MPLATTCRKTMFGRMEQRVPSASATGWVRADAFYRMFRVLPPKIADFEYDDDRRRSIVKVHRVRSGRNRSMGDSN